MVNTLNTDISERTATEEYQAVVRSLRRHKGFGLLFIECTPVGGEELITKIKKDLPQKKVGVLSLENPITNLIERVTAFPNQEILNILFITGLEKSLVEYIRPGYGGKGDYYNLDDIPPILSHLNWQRENFRDQFRHISFVFILQKFAIRYISLRAPDFFDWSSGVFIFPDDHKVSIPTINSRTSKLFEWLGYGLLAVTTITLLRINLPWPIVSLLVLFLGIFIGFLISGVIKAIRLKKDKNFVKSHFIKLVWRGIRATQFNILGEFINKPKNALSYFDNAIKLDLFYHQAWNNRGIALDDLGRNEEAIASFDEALKIKPDDHDVWYNRGIALRQLGRIEEAIASYDNALKFKPDYHEAWNNRGSALDDLGRFEEAIASYDHALKIKPDDHQAWNNRGNALDDLGRNEEAIASYDHALKIKPDKHEAWNNRGAALANLGRLEEAIASYDQALKIKPDKHEAWYNRGNALGNLGRLEEAIISFDNALKFNPDDASAYFNKACAYALQENIPLTIENLEQAINLDSKYLEMAKIDTDFDKIRHDSRFINLIHQSDSP
ncbi:MAG: hypothetical protein DCF12_16555 [Snowella sp.]|nr:MAG: hypothetical protein DCF12_16555 [Snowella sp.]